ncbi:MAG: Zn-dependent hydrolase [Gammaproteobacteria bacterium]|nr:Zn-dependent hydrolase [Gammaproteobacteria bacterium]
MTGQLRINGERLWARLMAMGEIGATPAGGCNRQALTDEDKAGRDLFVKWCREAGCKIRVDAIGNVFARRSGTDESLPPVITGSHLDTQPTGGKFDGIYGVLAGLEVIETLNDHDVETLHPIEAVVWTNEEGCRFDTAMMGSAVWAGAMPLQDAYALTDRDNKTVAEELTRIDYQGTHTAYFGPVKAAFEAHIEQGPILEAEQKTVGVVTGVQHMSRHRIVIEGKETHAGPTPMSIRQDPMLALADFLPRLYAMAEQHAPDARLTFGYIHTLPGSSNTVPGQLELTVDIRHPQKAAYDAMIAGYQEYVQQACDERGTPVSMECFWEAPGVEFNADCVNAVRKAVATTGYDSMEIVSGAGHDACNVAAVVPTGMIFIPCKDGLSHNEAESAEPEHVEAGCNVLLHAILERAE